MRPAQERRERWIDNIEQFPWIRIYWRALLATLIWNLAHVALRLGIIGGLLYYFMNFYGR